jgi:hypothetical protein
LAEAIGGPRSRDVNLAEAIRRRFQLFGGVDDLELPTATPAGEPPSSEHP